jgi:hypothetical protein
MKLARMTAAALLLSSGPALAGWYHTAPNSVDTPIPAGHPTLAPWPSSNLAGETCTNAEFIAELETAMGGDLNINVEHGWSIPHFQASTTDPTFTVTPDVPEPGNGATATANGWNVLRIPRTAYPDAHWVPTTEYRDRWMSVFAPDGSSVTDFFRMVRTDSGGTISWAAKSIRRWARSSTGYLRNYDNQGSARLCAMSMAHGTIRYDAITRDHEITHALTFAYSSPADSKVSGVDNSMFPCRRPYDMPDPPGGARPCALPLGIRLQYNPAANPTTVCAATQAEYRNSCIVIVEALQTYGMILVDRGDSLFAEPMRYQRRGKWTDFSSTGYALPRNGPAVLPGIDLGQFRTVEPVKP